MKKNILMMLAAFAAVAIIVGCSQGETIEAPAIVHTGDVTIQLRSTHQGVSGEVISRAPYVGAISVSNPLTASVLSSVSSGDYSAANLHANGTMTFVGRNTPPSSYDVSSLGAGSADLAKFPVALGPADPFYLAGLYPVGGWTYSATTPTTATINITGKEDVMAAAEVATTSGNVEAGDVETLNFDHLLTKLEISLRATTNTAAGKWGRVMKIELVEAAGALPKRQIVVDLQVGTGTPTPTNPAVMPLYRMSKAGSVASYTDTPFAFTDAADYVTLTETATVVAYTMIAPLDDAATEKLTFRISTESGAPVDVLATLPSAGSTKGQAFGITFKFDADEDAIMATATVGAWLPGGNLTVEE